MIVTGTVTVPGDKSITHRLLLLAGLSPGRSRIGSPLTSLDARSTAGLLRALGAKVSPVKGEVNVVVEGRKRFLVPRTVLNCGNSGTTARLSIGLLAAHDFRATLTGDASLRRRPMRRITEPLTVMGARFDGKDPDRLPLSVRGGPLRSIEWELPVSSAQIKGCLLFAGVAAECPVTLREPSGRSRDHTERLLRSFGYSVIEDSTGWIRFQPNGELEAFDLMVPGDPSSAAFLVGAALLAERGELRLIGIGMNPTRTGFLRILERMGAWVESVRTGIAAGEPVGDYAVSPSELRGTIVTPSEVAGVIDEIPMLAVLASRARGESRFLDVGELRVKESDRLSLLAQNLRAIGAKAAVEGNNLIVEGGSSPPKGKVKTEGDHRIAMAFEVLNAIKGASVNVDNIECAAVSFPTFSETLRTILVQGKSR